MNPRYDKRNPNKIFPKVYNLINFLNWISRLKIPYINLNKVNF